MARNERQAKILFKAEPSQYDGRYLSVIEINDETIWEDDVTYKTADEAKNVAEYRFAKVMRRIIR